MALVVETGDIVTGAESYISVADADTYFTIFGPSTAWAALNTSQKESSLRLATQFIDQEWKFHADLIDIEQPLSWPRTMFTDDDNRVVGGLGSMPIDLKYATAVLALQFSQSNPMTSVSEYSSDQNIKREKIGPSETEYYDGAAAFIATTNPVVKRYLSRLGRPKGLIRKVVRG